MLNGIRKLMTVDALSERVARLEAENERLRKENASRLSATSFHEVKRPMVMPEGSLRDFIYDCAARDLEGVVEDHLLTVAKKSCKAARPLGERHALYASVAAADMVDAQVEVVLPEVRTCFRVGGYFR